MWKKKCCCLTPCFLISPLICQARPLFHFPYTGYKNGCVWVFLFLLSWILGENERFQSWLEKALLFVAGAWKSLETSRQSGFPLSWEPGKLRLLRISKLSWREVANCSLDESHLWEFLGCSVSITSFAVREGGINLGTWNFREAKILAGAWVVCAVEWALHWGTCL